MKLKPISRERNKKTIMIYYSLAIIFISIGLYQKNSIWYAVAVAFLLLALFRKYWLMKRLKI